VSKRRQGELPDGDSIPTGSLGIFELTSTVIVWIASSGTPGGIEASRANDVRAREHLARS
jgi:hypothetical protein